MFFRYQSCPSLQKSILMLLTFFQSKKGTWCKMISFYLHVNSNWRSLRSGWAPKWPSAAVAIARQRLRHTNKKRIWNRSKFQTVYLYLEVLIAIILTKKWIWKGFGYRGALAHILKYKLLAIAMKCDMSYAIGQYPRLHFMTYLITRVFNTQSQQSLQHTCWKHVLCVEYIFAVCLCIFMKIIFDFCNTWKWWT